MIILNDSNYLIKKSKRGYVVINLKGLYKNHSHFKNIGTAKKCIYLTKNRIVPKSFYMMVACIRLSTDELYIRKIQKLKEVKENKQNIKYKNKKVSDRKSSYALA
ncbi:hypothetical protein [Clostridium ganghwense]|uniref:Uncharacterized protein n=1 Tax=Clostridium ganghwense TaxID=312089 RepID=A0ABT4CRQ2_9CLOT|nr:hypothetical protein [Clostridium ganghwense]MCY6371736.1 hypothetical protein [Clostridium ganghwense]